MEHGPSAAPTPEAEAAAPAAGGPEGPGSEVSAADGAVLKHHLASRWMHWINFPLITIMIWSGLRIYWADTRDPYGFGVGLVGWHWFDFLPDSVNQALGLERRLARGLAFHFTFGWFFALNGLAYALYTWRSGEWRHLLPGKRSLRDAVAVIRHDLHLGGELPEQGRYNAAQSWTYTLVIGLGALALLTGFAIYRPTQLSPLTTLFGGYESARTIHFFVTVAFLVFFVIHLLQVARAGWPNFASMITGYERIKAAAPGAANGAAPNHALAPADGEFITAEQYRQKSRRGFLTAGAAVVGAGLGWRWLQARPEENRAIDVLRRGHEFNESLWRRLSRERATAPTFAREASSKLRVNGRQGLRSDIDLSTWELTVIGPDGSVAGTHTMEEITALPKVELTVEHKCVEGWSHIVTWGGVRFSELMSLYDDGFGAEYVSLETPDGEYYVGLDMPSMRNPQMLLAYELQGEALELEHGAPLRLATPNKYGIKCIKRIGTIRFTNEQPTDFWYERGYDWYAQL